VAAHSAATDTRGSIFLDVAVPDFEKDAVSLSGVVLSLPIAAWPVAPARVLQDVVPVVPTSQREFLSTDPVMAFVRLYQRNGTAPEPLTVNVRIEDAAGARVFDRRDQVPADRFSQQQSSDYQFRLPLETLKTGEYLLTFETTRAKVTARRDVRFSVR